MCIRFKLPIKELAYKRFKRTYYEIKYKLHTTQYVPNFDNYSIYNIKSILENIYEKNLNTLNDDEILILFKKVMSKETKELERDIQFLS